MENKEPIYIPGSLIKSIRELGVHLKQKGVPDIEIFNAKNARATSLADELMGRAHSIFEDESISIHDRRIQSSICDFEAMITSRLANAGFF